MEFNRLHRFFGRVACISLIGVMLVDPVSAGYVRKNKMFDVSQYANPSWGGNWCTPTAVGNSFGWLAKEYGLNDLLKDPVTGWPQSVEQIIGDLGELYMRTNPNVGTYYDSVLPAKQGYINDHGLGGKIRVESQVAIPLVFEVPNEAKPDEKKYVWARYDGMPVTKKWLMDQFDKGQDVEFNVGYYTKFVDKDNSIKWIRKGGHSITLGGEVPGESAGGHME